MVKIQALGYVVAESTDVAKWKQYGEQVLGMSTAPAGGGGLYLKMDEQEFRIQVVPGTTDRYFASGWDVESERAFDHAVTVLKKAGVEVVEASVQVKGERKAQKLVSFSDPSGNRHELRFGVTGKSAPFKSPIGVKGFKTGEQGMGHTVLPSLQFDATLKFFKDTLGFGVSDIMKLKMAPDAPEMRIYFLHAAGGRHHSLALAEMPSPSGCVHIMVEVTEKEEVDKGLARMENHGVKLMATLGQHENDKMTSFYMMTPGMFPLEYGWGGIAVDPGTWKTTEGQRVSIWGHDFSVGFR